MSSDVRTVLMTAPDLGVGERVGRALVEEGLAACANVVPGLVSVYRWEGRVERADEVMVILKTVRDTVDPLLRRAAELHPYDVPELLVLGVEGGHAPYLDWVRTSCTAAPAADG